MRCVAISDTHNRAESVAIPDGDVLLHAGDLTMKGRWEELARAARWLGSLRERYRAVVAIPGNHDLGAEGEPDETRELFEAQGIVWLVDQPATIDGVTFYGSPWQPWFLDWAFNFPRYDDGAQAREIWSRIPPETQVLITHGPPHGILDFVEPLGEHVGCPHLLAAIRERPAIRAHVFGHVHEGYGETREAETRFINASTCDQRYAAVNPPIAFEL